MTILPWSNLAPSEHDEWVRLLRSIPPLYTSERAAEFLRNGAIGLLKNEVMLTKEIESDGHNNVRRGEGSDDEAVRQVR